MDYLQTRFEAFTRGECDAAAFGRELLMLCRLSPERAWRAFALLDQFCRQRKIPEAYCRQLRSRLAHRAMQLEGHTILPAESG